MVRHASLFSQLVALFNRPRFAELVYRHRAERYAKGFSCWDQFVAMLFCQIAQAKSLREISGGLKSCLGKLRHLGVKTAPNKSTLSYANAHRPWQLFEELFYQSLDWCRLAAPSKIRKFRFKNKLLSMDSTAISLCLSLFPWAKFRRTKGAVKLHLLLDHDGYPLRSITIRQSTPQATAWTLTRYNTKWPNSFSNMLHRVYPGCWAICFIVIWPDGNP